MKKRSPVAVFLLSIITFGIYDIYWLVVTKKELNAKTKIHTPTVWLLFAPYILIFGFAVIAGIMAAGSSPSASSTNSAFAVFTLVLYGLSFLLILPITFYWFFNFSKAVHEYTSGKMSTGVSFLLLWLLHLLGVAIIQDTFNDMIDAGSMPAMSGAPTDQMAASASPNMNPMQPPAPTEQAGFPAPETPDQQPPAGPTAG